jgi:hypothetical protein
MKYDEAAPRICKRSCSTSLKCISLTQQERVVNVEKAANSDVQLFEHHLLKQKGHFSLRYSFRGYYLALAFLIYSSLVRLEWIKNMSDGVHYSQDDL